MLKLICFDLDNVLVDTKDLHFQALQYACKYVAGFDLTKDYHNEYLEALPTKTKISILNNHNLVDKLYNDEIYKEKQRATELLFAKHVKPDQKIEDILVYCRNNFRYVHLASNCIRSSVDILLKRLEIADLFDFTIANTEIELPKPHPEMYMKCILQAKVVPIQTLIVEDSLNGKLAAILSGAHVLETDINSISIKQIEDKVKLINMLRQY